MIKFVLMLTKQGRTRFSHYFEEIELKECPTLEADLSRRIRQRSSDQCSFFDYQDFRIVYRLFHNIYIVVATDTEENQVSILEFIQLFMETLHTYFSPVTEIDVSFSENATDILL
ncbi:putative AP-4 complex subunit sigma-1-like [Apostichopus japonicus]|uniref:AP complex subunit sigma n=1 Tax=Stichopus japonicus TaxID=307972 RepID=A0A2G8KX72_STIJA|nr:putative AP-4 complex subunit sigma-1-like [Apostichopus japonicus]